MAAPSRFPGGVTNAAKNTTLWNLPDMDPTKVHGVFHDFDTYASANFTNTETGSGTRALTAVDGGCLLITNAAADDDRNFFQHVAGSFLMASGKRAWFKTRFKVSDATQSDWQVGLVVLDTTPLDATDGIYFIKADGAATYDFIVRKDATTGSNATTAVGTCVADTFVTLGWYYDGKSSCSYFIDDVQIGTVDASSTYLPDAQLCLSFGIQNGEAVAKTMTMDYIGAWKER